MGRPRHRNEDGQLALISMVLVLLIGGILTAVAFGAFKGTNPGGAGGSGLAPVGTAGDVQAETSLTNAVEVAAQTGLFGSLSAATMSQDGGGGIAYTASASTGPQVVSVVSTGDLSGGSAEMAVLSTSGNCWYAWLAGGMTTFYGVSPHPSLCQAVAMPATPAVGATPSATVIGWKQGGYPTP